MTRLQNQVEFFLSGTKKSVSGGTWSGKLPKFFDFSLKLLPGEKSELTVTKWHVYRTNSGRASTARLPKPGTAIAYRNREMYPNVGGGDPGFGYIWKKGEDAAIQMTVCSLENRNTEYLLDVRITDYLDRPESRQELKIQTRPAEPVTVAIRLPSRRYGYFNLHTTLRDASGHQIEDEKVIGFAIARMKSPGELSDRSIFGIHGHGFGTQGIKHQRYWDSGMGFFWSHIERTKGVFDYALGDAFLDKTLKAGMTPLIVLCGTAEWASTSSGNTYIGRGAMHPPKDISTWREYCRKTAKRYKGRVRHYEVWNEPNSNALGPVGFFFSSDCEHYFELVKNAYEAIKSVDPEAQILAPSGTGNFFPFLKRFLELGGGRYFDILSIHTYFTPFPPEIGYYFNAEKSFRYRVEKSRSIMKEYGISKPVWNTELGYHGGLTTRFDGKFITQDQIASEALETHWPNWTKGWSFRPLDPRRTAAFLSRVGVLAKVYDVERVYFHHSLLNRDEPYLPLPAVAWINQLLDGASYLRTIPIPSTKNLHLYEFKLKNGKILWAVWQVYKESLVRNSELARQLKNVETAPVAGIADQKGIDTVKLRSLNREKHYFSPGDRKMLHLKLSTPPENVCDLWGNSLPAGKRYDITENPLFLEFKEPPRKTPEVKSGKDIEDAGNESDGEFAGRLAPSSKKEQIPETSVREIFRYLHPYNLKSGTLSPGCKWENKKNLLMLNANESITLFPQKGMPERGRVVFSARASNNSSEFFTHEYRLFQENTEIPLLKCSAIPLQVLMQGSKWVVARGYLLSSEIDLTKPITIRALQPNSHIMNVWATTFPKPH